MGITEVYAMAQQGQGSAGGSPNQFLLFLPWIAIFAIMYFIMIRPQKKRQKEHQAMLGQLQKNDKVITNSGLTGTILNIDEEKAIIKISEVKGEPVKVEVLRNSIAAKTE